MSRVRGQYRGQVIMSGPIMCWHYLVISRPPGQVQLLGRPPPHLCCGLWPALQYNNHMGSLVLNNNITPGQSEQSPAQMLIRPHTCKIPAPEAFPDLKILSLESRILKCVLAKTWFLPQLGMPNLSTALLTTFSGLNVFPENNIGNIFAMMISKWWCRS